MKRILFCLTLLAAAGAAQGEFASGGPYVPTPQAVVDEMLKLAKVGPGDFVIDLGSGDGRVVLTAAQRFRARGLGVDINRELVAASNAEAQQRDVAHLVRFHEQDIFEARIGEATVVTLYLMPTMMQTLRPRMLFELKPGTRVVSHDFDFGDWRADNKVQIEVKEKYGTSGAFVSSVLLWIVPARVEGEWRVTSTAGAAKPFLLRLKQEFQQFQGSAGPGKRAAAVKNGRLNGASIRFELALPGTSGAAQQVFEGTVDKDNMSGHIRSGTGESLGRWTAVRVETLIGAP